MCFVEVEKSPKPVIACAMPALLEMTIKTYTLVARKAREDMMEFLLVNHLLGCPIFYPGGKCDRHDLDANDEINSGREEEVEKTKDLIKAKFRKQGSSVEFLVQMREYTKKKKRTF